MPKLGNYATAAHTEFELNPMQNFRVRVKYGSGGGKIGANVVRHLKVNSPCTSAAHTITLSELFVVSENRAYSVAAMSNKS